MMQEKLRVCDGAADNAGSDPERRCRRKGRVILEVPDIVSGCDKVESFPLPLTPQKRLVEWDRTGCERQGAVVVVTKEVRRSKP